MARREFRFRDGIAIAQVVVFSVFLSAGIWIRYQRKAGWFSVTAMSGARLAGAACLLATINSYNKGIYAGTFVCEALCMVLLVFVLLGFLKRV